MRAFAAIAKRARRAGAVSSGPRLSSLPQDILSSIIDCISEPRDLLALACTSRAVRPICVSAEGNSAVSLRRSWPVRVS
jgi:hypothetical protein